MSLFLDVKLKTVHGWFQKAIDPKIKALTTESFDNNDDVIINNLMQACELKIPVLKLDETGDNLKTVEDYSEELHPPYQELIRSVPFSGSRDIYTIIVPDKTTQVDGVELVRDRLDFKLTNKRMIANNDAEKDLLEEQYKERCKGIEANLTIINIELEEFYTIAREKLTTIIAFKRIQFNK